MPRYGDLEHVEKFVSDMINRSEIGYAGVQILSELYAMPIADVVEVVRCKDCKHWMGDGNNCKMYIVIGNKVMYNWYAEDFCSYGERRDDG